MHSINLTYKEIKQGIGDWHFWGYLGWSDIRGRYRRSVFGPLWVTFSMAIFIAAIGIVYSKLFKMDLHDYLPFLATGYLIWFFISTVIGESCFTFLEAAGYIRDIKLPLTLFTSRNIWRNFLIFLHNSIVIIIAFIALQFNPGWHALLVIPGFLLIVANLYWMALFLAIIGTRFRDIPPIIQSLIQVLFFVSPIAWLPKLVGENSLVVKLNPVSYFLDVFRSPLLGQAPETISWIVMIALLLIGGIVTFFLYMRSYKRVVFWL